MADDAFVFVDANLDIFKDKPTKTQVDDVKPPEVKSLHVVSNVRNRYARTVVTSLYYNGAENAQETTFSIVLPDTAFISGFVMEIEGKKYEAYVKEKEAAKQEYNEAVSQGKFAAHVAVSARDSNKFTVSVNVQARSDVTFILTYEELLVRKHSKYEMLINLHPGQLIDDLKVDVHINETRPVTNIQVPALKSGKEITKETTNNKHATIKKESDNIVHITFHPTIDQQKEMSDKLSNDGISGQFAIEYDVERDPLGGEVLVNDGYFVHFFAPTDLKPIPKHVIFVLDVSGSMDGRKIEQLRDAMKVILSELNPEDYFNIVKFSSKIQILFRNSSMKKQTIVSLQATKENIDKAQKVVSSIETEGCTNINDALITALSLTEKGISAENTEKHKPQPIIVFLTDGQPNVSESDPDKIVKNVISRNEGKNKAAIFTLAFGEDANKDFLKELAIKNSGFMRNIYEAADASLQLLDFYKQISSPLLTNVNFKYSKQVKEITKHKFDILFNGSEFVVTGKIDEVEDGFVIVEGSTLYGKNDFRPTILAICPEKEDNDFGNLERLWAYMTIKQLLDKKYEKKSEDKHSKSEKQALKLALKYSFVTPVTSLVVVKPEEKEENDLQWGSVQVKSTQSQGYCYRSAPSRIVQRGGGGPAFSSPQSSTALHSGSLFGGPANFSYGSSDAFSQGAFLAPSENRSGGFFGSALSSAKGFISPKKKAPPVPNVPSLKSMEVEINIQNDDAQTVIKYLYRNEESRMLKTELKIYLPETAIITDFYMEIDGQKYNSRRGKMNEVLKLYTDAVTHNLTAAHMNRRSPNTIIVPMNVEAKTDITFILKYNQYLIKEEGTYKMPFYLNPLVVIDNLEMNIKINNDRPITGVSTKIFKMSYGDMAHINTTINKNDDGSYNIFYKPTTTEQSELIKTLKETESMPVPREFTLLFRADSEESEKADNVPDFRDDHFVVVKSPEYMH